MNVESPPCPVCGGTVYRPHLRLTDVVSGTTDDVFTLAQCDACGLLRTVPLPDDEVLARAYPADYAPFVRPGLSGRAKAFLERRVVRRLWNYLRPPRRVLDLGCAGGDLMDAVRRAGNDDLLGIEPDAGAVEIARSRGFEVIHGVIEDAALPAGSISTVLLDHVVEHLPQPDETLREINRVLIPGGALVLWLPNVDSWAAKTLRRYWMGYDVPRHLTTYSIETIRCQLAVTGFRVVRVDHEWTGVEWAWGLRLWTRARAPMLDPVLTRLHTPLILASTPLAALAAARCQSGRICVVAIKTREVTSPVSRRSPGA